MVRGATIATIAALLLPVFYAGCSEDDNAVSPPAEIQVLHNPDVESGADTPEGWLCAGADTLPGGLRTTWSTEEAVSPTHSLKITQTIVSDDNAFAFWGQWFISDIPAGRELTLTASIKSDLTGPGAAIVLRGDDTIPPAGSAEAFSTTQGVITITGEEDWREYWVTMAEVPDGIVSITVYLILLANSTGAVYFDDITVTYPE